MLSTHIATQIYAKICFAPTSGQKKIIEMLSEYLADDDFSRIFVLNGYAGTGKTTLIAAPVSYTHLDVYKRQGYGWPTATPGRGC